MSAKMENYAVAADAVVASKRKRITHPPEVIEKAVTSARHVGAEAAARTLNKTLSADEQVPDGTIRKWLHRFKKDGKFWEKEVKRGRPDIIHSVPGAVEEWQRQVDGFRVQGESVTGRVSATIARAVLEERAPSLLERHGGSAKMCLMTGKNMLSTADNTWRKRTSAKIIPPAEDVASARDKFYKDVAEAFLGQDVDLSLLINYDQTFQLFHPTRGYTWEKKGADRVQLLKSKDGFTLLPVVSAAGMVAAQMIFQGTTPAVHPDVSPGALLRYTHTHNHWSNETTTLELWRTVIIPYIHRRRSELHVADAPAMVFADDFPAHWTSNVQALVSAETGIAYICVPDGLTNVFQPLDLGIIAALKNSVLRRQDDFLEKEVRQAIRENRSVVLSRSRIVLRKNVTMFIKEALADPNICAERCCRSGFERAGILRVLLGARGGVPDVDLIVPPRMCDECGELADSTLDLPECSCFENVDAATLCAGCHNNHTVLCSMPEHNMPA